MTCTTVNYATARRRQSLFGSTTRSSMAMAATDGCCGAPGTPHTRLKTAPHAILRPMYVCIGEG